MCKLKLYRTTRLEVVVDDGWPNLVEVLKGVDDLHDNRAALLLGHQLILLQVEVQIVAFTVLQHCAEPARATTDVTHISHVNKQDHQMIGHFY